MREIPSHKYFTIFKSDDIDVGLEYSEEVVAVHFKDFTRMTSKTFRDLKKELEGFLPFLQMNGYRGLFAGIPREYSKNKRLANLLGFTYIGSEKGIDIYLKE